jgi:VanZ family protein
MRTQISRWLPTLLMILVIFWFSAQPGSELLPFDWADKILKKGGHMVGYALLALLYWRAFEWKEERRWIAWLLAVLYAVTDEFHQSFVPGRYPSIWDILIFDNFGALISLWLANTYRKEKRPDSARQSSKSRVANG